LAVECFAIARACGRLPYFSYVDASAALGLSGVASPMHGLHVIHDSVVSALLIHDRDLRDQPIVFNAVHVTCAWLKE